MTNYDESLFTARSSMQILLFVVLFAALVLAQSSVLVGSGFLFANQLPSTLAQQPGAFSNVTKYSGDIPSAIPAGATVGFGVEPTTENYLLNGSYADQSGLGFDFEYQNGFSECGPVGMAGQASCQEGRFSFSLFASELIYDLILITMRKPTSAANTQKISLPAVSANIQEWGLFLVLQQNWTTLLSFVSESGNTIGTVYGDLAPTENAVWGTASTSSAISASWSMAVNWIKDPYGFSFSFSYDRGGGVVTLSSYGPNSTFALLEATPIELPGRSSSTARALYWVVSAFVGPQ